ncbi:MAG TPA: sigma-70 family RNA polymerase sigma factor [Terriglobales bacterium]|nr:sigma-70 family RNA polymerase sigma factor [Terriglobales bacterium]
MAEPQAVGQFEAILRQNQGMVFSIAYHLLHDRTLAEEVAQDVFLQLHKQFSSMKSAEHVVFWLRKITVHRAIDCARSRASRPEWPLDDVPEPAVAGLQPDPMLSRRLRQLVISLPERARAVVVLRYQEDMDFEEIAEALGMPVATVKSNLQRALAMLREKVSRTMGDVRA